jgi:hypothetical protein
MVSAITIAVVAAAAVLLVLGLRARRRDTATEAAPPPEVALDPTVADFIEAAHTAPSETDKRYVDALERLRRDPEDAARQLENAYRSVDDNQIRVRESLLLAASALRHQAILPLLTDVAREPVRGTARHDGGRALEESVLRLIAVDGIEAIAQIGDAAAADALVTLTASSDRAVQAAAVVALKYSDAHRARFDELRETLPADRRYLLDVVRADVRDVPQIDDPRRHLAAEPTTRDARPDASSGKRRAELPTERARPPRAEEKE